MKLFGRNVEWCYVESDGTHNYHCTLKGYRQMALHYVPASDVTLKSYLVAQNGYKTFLRNQCG